MIARQMAFTTQDGAEHSQAWWRLVGLYADTSGVRLLFYGYHDKEAYDAGAAPMQGAQKEYVLPASVLNEGGDFDQLVTAIHGAAWQIALNTQDTGSPPTSFFANSVEAQ